MSFRKLLAIAKDVSWRAAAGFSDRVPYPSVCPECKYWSLEHFPEGSFAFPDIKFKLGVPIWTNLTQNTLLVLVLPQDLDTKFFARFRKTSRRRV
jgi:hypothetical protein